MATTTNFGWETPDDTDLVKDGALAIRTLGSAIDTSLVDLKGGTTGQVLSKTSNTDMDFTWVTSDDANAIQNAIVDAKGDLIAASAADTPARLAVGNNGETLVADSSATTGLRWQPALNTNAIINGGYDIWQRGTSFTAADVYTADRWKKDSQTYSTLTRQTTGDTTNLPTIQYCARVARNSGQTGTAALGVIYSAETADAIRYAGQAVVVSFYARAGANYSAASSNISYNFYTGTGTDQSRSFGVQFTGEANIASSTKTLTTTWQRFSFTATIGATATEWALMFYFNGVGTAGAADYFEITGVQLELGSVATTFKRAGSTLAGELAACMRYFYSLNSANNVYSNFGNGVYSSSTIAQIIIPLPVPMRVTPSISVGTVGNYAVDGVAGNNCSNLVTGQLSPQVIGLSATTAASTTGYACYLRAANTLNAAIQISAEL